MPEKATLTDLIRRVRDGDAEALRLFFDTAYDDLRRMAQTRLRQRPRMPLLDTTSLVHESYLRLASAGDLQLEDRAHFFRYAGQVMRSVIVDVARARLTARRGGDARQVTLDTGIGGDLAGEEQILRVHEALEELREHDERLAQVVEMRYFGGMTDEDIADVLGLTDRTVRRDWEKARLLLARALG
jgi:RNA polymerase sigma factor (TIGR02999 family)